jgi:hypothetical protein
LLDESIKGTGEFLRRSARGADLFLIGEGEEQSGAYSARRIRRAGYGRLRRLDWRGTGGNDGKNAFTGTNIQYD